MTIFVLFVLAFSLSAAYAQDNRAPGAPFDILGLRQRAIEQRQEMRRRSEQRMYEIEMERVKEKQAEKP